MTADLEVLCDRLADYDLLELGRKKAAEFLAGIDLARRSPLDLDLDVPERARRPEAPFDARSPWRQELWQGVLDVRSGRDAEGLALRPLPRRVPGGAPSRGETFEGGPKGDRGDMEEVCAGEDAGDGGK